MLVLDFFFQQFYLLNKFTVNNEIIPDAYIKVVGSYFDQLTNEK